MKDQLELLGKKLQKRLDLIGIVLFVALLLVVGFFYQKEQQFELDEVQPPPPRPWDVKIPNDSYNKVMASFTGTQTDILKDDRARRLIQFNMFDLRSVQNEAERERAIAPLFNEAQKMYDAKDYDGALQKLDEILQRYPTHYRSLDLKKKAEAERPAETTGEGDGEAEATP